MDFVFRKSAKTNMKNYGTVSARFRSGGKAKYCSLGISIREAEWNKYRSNKWVPSNVIMSSLGIKYGDFASMLAEIKNVPETDFDTKKIKKLIEKFICESKEVDKEEKHLLLNKDELLLSEFMLKYYEDLKSGKRLKKQQSVSVSESYMQEIKSARNSIIKYEAACEKRFLLCDVDMTFRNGYIKWLRDQELKPNYIKSLLRSISTVMKSALEDGLTKNDAFLRKGFVPAGEQADAVYLSMERLKELIAFDLTYNADIKKRFEDVLNKGLKEGESTHKLYENDFEKIAIARDIFVVGCLTGQRISDYKRISKEMIETFEGKKFITLVQDKTKKKVMIPLDKRVASILDKYDGKLPKIREDTFNKHLRLITEVMGWTETPTFDKAKVGGDTGRRFCDLITSHTARRTFATNAYSYGVPLASIMAVTGQYRRETEDVPTPAGRRQGKACGKRPQRIPATEEECNE